MDYSPLSQLPTPLQISDLYRSSTFCSAIWVAQISMLLYGLLFVIFVNIVMVRSAPVVEVGVILSGGGGVFILTTLWFVSAFPFGRKLR